MQCIFEFLHINKNLPSNLDPEWVRKHFSIFDNKLCFIRSNKTVDLGDPPDPPGVATLLEVSEYEDLIDTVKVIHESQGHASTGTTIRKTNQKY